MATSKTLLDQLVESKTVVVADTADFNVIAQYNPSEGTTNPSILFAAAQQPQYASFLENAVAYASKLNVTSEERIEAAVEHLAVQFGVEIQKLTGRVATEVDVKHSFDTKRTIEAAQRVIALYEQYGVHRDQVRIKISATWEGIQAARILESEHGINTLVTIVFGLVQAITAAEAEVTMIAPYVGRIGDWYKAQNKNLGVDMGVQTVREMQTYLRQYGHKTKLMGASFRNTDQVMGLAGADTLTIAPAILEQLRTTKATATSNGVDHTFTGENMPQRSYINDEAAFRWAFNSDACAVEKSADAMRRFADDTDLLKGLLAKHLL